MITPRPRANTVSADRPSSDDLEEGCQTDTFDRINDNAVKLIIVVDVKSLIRIDGEVPVSRPPVGRASFSLDSCSHLLAVRSAEAHARHRSHDLMSTDVRTQLEVCVCHSLTN
jgi:hypothetical protein